MSASAQLGRMLVSSATSYTAQQDMRDKICPPRLDTARWYDGRMDVQKEGQGKQKRNKTLRDLDYVRKARGSVRRPEMKQEATLQRHDQPVRRKMAN